MTNFPPLQWIYLCSHRKSQESLQSHTEALSLLWLSMLAILWMHGWLVSWCVNKGLAVSWGWVSAFWLYSPGFTETHHPLMSATVTFDPKDVDRAILTQTGRGSLYSWTPILNPLVSQREPEPFPRIYGHKSTFSPVLHCSTQRCPLTWAHST